MKDQNNKDNSLIKAVPNLLNEMRPGELCWECGEYYYDCNTIVKVKKEKCAVSQMFQLI